jgi:flagellar basal body rod protein FlgG
MRSRIDQLDRLAADISNINTAGYKGEVTSDAEADRPFAAMLQSAIDVSTGSRRLDTTAGSIEPTGRDLDVAIEGKGFFAIQTPGGVRFTRNGRFTRQVDGTLATEDGSPVLANGGGTLTVPRGKVDIGTDGTLKVGGVAAGKLELVEFADPGRLVRENRATLRAPDGMAPLPAENTAVRGGALEQSNVSVGDRIAALTEVMRTFETLQKAVSLQMNDLDARAIDVLGRRG